MNVYFILERGEQKGPFTFKELDEMDIDIHTRILSPLDDSWQDACDLPEFYPYFEARGIYLPTGDNLASFGWRLLAWIVDYFIVSFLASFVFKALVAQGFLSFPKSYDELIKAPLQAFFLQMVFLIPMIIYNSICEASPMQGSFGKKLCRLVVVDIDGQALSYPKAFLRSLGKAVSIIILYLGFISILFTEHRQALHDMFAKTYVVKL